MGQSWNFCVGAPPNRVEVPNCGLCLSLVTGSKSRWHNGMVQTKDPVYCWQTCDEFVVNVMKKNGTN